MTAAAENLVKMAEFAKMAGVPAATIKHYVREGLLPEPERTSRTTAWYDPAWSSRVQTIKELQRRFFLPLPVIKELLTELDDDGELPELAVMAAITRVLEAERGTESRTRAQLLESGMPEPILDVFIDMGVITPTLRDGEQCFDGDDLALLRTLKEARRVGLSPEMLPPSILAEYMGALGNLVRIELDLFRRGVMPRMRAELDEGGSVERVSVLTEHATRLSERLVVLLRRQLLEPTLRELFAEVEDPDPDPDPES